VLYGKEQSLKAHRMTKIVATLLISLAMTGTALADVKSNLSILAPGQAPLNTRKTAQVKVSPVGPYKMNTEYPLKLTLTAPAGVTLEKAVLTAKDASKFDDTTASFDVAFTATSRGKKAFTGQYKFAVCTETDCFPQSKTVTFDIDVI
jgi:hypothetical protein